jgi:transcriptional regulator with XRE-family HTH domain
LANQSEAKAIGMRMKQAAQAKGLTAYAIAERLGPRPPTIYRWWQGRHLPDREMMRRYAELVGVSVGSLYGEAVEEIPHMAMQMFVRAIELVLAGQPFSASAAQVMRERGLERSEQEEVAAFEQRAKAADAAVKDWLDQVLDDWADLSPQERKTRLELLAGECLAVVERMNRVDS